MLQENGVDVRGVLVTAISSGTFVRLPALIRSAQQFLPADWPIIVYDLIGDLAHADVATLASWCGVVYRLFGAGDDKDTRDIKFPVFDIWKPLIISACLHAVGPGGVVLYADSSARLNGKLSSSLLAAALNLGFLGQRAPPTARHTHSQMLSELAHSRRESVHTNSSSPQGGKPRDLEPRKHFSYMMILSAATACCCRAAPIVCSWMHLWAHTPFSKRQLLDPWIACMRARSCIAGRRPSPPTKCRPGLEGHNCLQGEESALSAILYGAFQVSERGSAPYVLDAMPGPESWDMCDASIHGFPSTGEHVSDRTTPLTYESAQCERSRAVNGARVEHGLAVQEARSHAHSTPQASRQPNLREGFQSAETATTDGDCSNLLLTRVAVPTGVQPIFPGKGGAASSLRRLLKPCATRHACTVGASGCISVLPSGQTTAIAKCNETHGVEYKVRLPEDGEPAIVSFFNPSATQVHEALSAISRARPRLYLEFEPPVHARVPQSQVLKAVDGQMTYLRRALVNYPYFSASQLWASAVQPPVRRGFLERRAAIAVFVSNCRGHRADAIDWLRRNFEVHSYGACKHGGGNATGLASLRRQRVEGGHFPECLSYRAVVAIENNACEDYVSEKLLEAVRCGAVPIVRSVKGLPDYEKLLGPLPLLDAANLDEDFAKRVRAVLTRRDVWESYVPAYNPGVVPQPNAVASLEQQNPHCQIIELAAKYRNPNHPYGSVSNTNATAPRAVRCETWYKLVTPRGIQVLPRPSGV